jgi:acetyl esterase/lipase
MATLNGSPRTITNPATTIVSVHGGGFVTTCAEMYYNSLTPLVRRGFTVAVLDYPLAPQARHPEPLLSVLRALAFLHEAPYNMTDVHLMGDSAGANIILLAAAVIKNPSMWPELDLVARGWRFPTIHSAISIYGMLSPATAATASGVVGLGLRFLWRCHGGTTNRTPPDKVGSGAVQVAGKGALFEIPCAFDDLLIKQQQASGRPKLELPPTFFAVGDIDPLLNDTLVVHSRMASMFTRTELPLELHVYPYGFHGFFGVPPEWQKGFVNSAAKPCSDAVVKFLCPGEELPLPGPCALRHEYYGLLMVVLFMMMPFAVAGPPILLARWVLDAVWG